jgi:hypothetical protein
MVRIEVFREIIRHLIMPKDNQLLEEQVEEIRTLEPSNLSLIKSQIAYLDNILEQRPRNISFAYPFILFFRAHCYNLGFYGGEELYFEPAISSAGIALTGFQANLNIFDRPLNDFNNALSHLYLGLLHFNDQDFRACHNLLIESDRMYNDLQETCRQEGLFERCEEIQWLRYILRQWMQATIRKEQNNISK